MLVEAGDNIKSNRPAPLCLSAPSSFLTPMQELQQQTKKSSNHYCFLNPEHGRLAVFSSGTGLPKSTVEEQLPMKVSLLVVDATHH